MSEFPYDFVNYSEERRRLCDEKLSIVGGYGLHSLDDDTITENESNQNKHLLSFFFFQIKIVKFNLHKNERKEMKIKLKF